MTDTVSWDDLLKTADEAGFSVLDVGEYDVRVKTAEAVKAKSSGNNMIKVNFEVISGPSKGRSGIWNNFVINPENPNSVGFFFRNMDTLGLKRDYFASKPTMAKVATDLVGRTARITIEHEEYNGQTQMRVKNVKKVPGGAAVPTPTPATSPQPQPTPTPAPQPTPAPVATPQPAAPAPAPTPAPEVPAQPAAPVTETAPAPSEAQAAPTAERPAPPVSPF